MGAGKTTVIKGLMNGEAKVAKATITPLFDPSWPKRKGPIGYEITGLADEPTFIPGSYEVAIASGCDTIKDVAKNFALIKEAFEDGYNVVYEGLFMMNHTRGVELQKQTKSITVLRLKTTLDECLKGVQNRRAAQGVEKVLSDNFLRELKGSDVRARNYAKKMKAVGARVFHATRDEAPDLLLWQLRGG